MLRADAYILFFSCRGVFGCHTALVLRRLRRLCEGTYRCSPTFVVTSATVANARQHVQDLLGTRYSVLMTGLILMRTWL